MTNKNINNRILSWAAKIGPHKKYPFAFIEYPEVNEGLDLLLEYARAIEDQNTQLILKIQHEIARITRISKQRYCHEDAPMIRVYENVLKWIREEEKGDEHETNAR